jgi:hypothetical protein
MIIKYNYIYSHQHLVLANIVFKIIIINLIKKI